MMRFICTLTLLLLCSFSSDAIFAQSNESKARVIVIDAGHGGKAFPGATYGGVMEKDINLAVALKLGALLEKEMPDAKIVYTRTTDTALGKTLNEDLTARANIANKAGGDFFISIHANAATKSSVYGPETLIMGESEKETRYNESALYNNNKEELIDMSDENTAAMVRAYIQNLQFTYGEYSEMMARIMQSHYAKGGRNVRKTRRQLLKVLYATDMPSVLTELGFMTNSQELAYMKSQKGQNELARMLCNAVKEYFSRLDNMAGVDADSDTANESAAGNTATKAAATKASTTKTTTPKESASSSTTSKTESAKSSDQESVKAASDGAKSTAAQAGFTIQVMASDKKLAANDPQFKSYRGKIRRLEGSGVLKYKYCYGEFSTRAEAQSRVAEVGKSFKGAFVVQYKGDKIVK